MLWGEMAYTNGSLTDTTNTLPASLSFELDKYPGMCFAEQAGPFEQKDQLLSSAYRGRIAHTEGRWYSDNESPPTA